MKRISIIIIVLLVGTALLYRLEPMVLYNLKDNLTRVFGINVPCQEPILYNLAKFDTKFNISQEYFLGALQEAEVVWEKSVDLDLFTYQAQDSSQKVLKVNLIYDYRQEATKKLSSIGIEVKNTRASYDELKAKFDATTRDYEKEKEIFNKKVADFNQRTNSYGEEVKYWNERGGAPNQEYQELESKRRGLENESKELNQMEASINKKADEINAMVVVLNRLVATLNLSVDKYNTTSVARGESFEEGVYSSDGRTREIDIYEFSSRNKLVRVLTHELGHALGLGHVADPKAMMYELNEGSSTTLAEADILALKTRCNIDK